MKPIALFVLLAGCVGNQEAEPAAAGFAVHEWGTYTSAQSSAGQTLDGMHRSDEALPGFVHGRAPGGGSKEMETVPEPVNQRLETPVLYFHSDRPLDVRVEVDFPRGVVSQWYPAASSFAPAIGEMTAIAGGTMSWGVEVLPTDLEVPPVPADSVWAPSRRVAAASVRSGGEAERFIFYRGLGRFEVPVLVRATDDEIEIRNDSSDRIPAAFVLNVHEGGAGVFAVGPLPPGGRAVSRITPKELHVPAYLEHARSLLVEALVDSGLRADEALAMVDTWNASYFLEHGVRVLYVAPRTWTDELLPIRIEPRPDRLVRTLVGRIEVLTPSIEAEVVAMVEESMGGAFPFEELGTLAEPKLRRALDLLPDDATRARCLELIDYASRLP